MKRFLLILYFLPIACDSDSKDKISLEKSTSYSKVEKEVDKSISHCDIQYDTIINKSYRMHLAILDKYNHKEKRGYILNTQGDTINNFLYDQDVSAFVSELNPNEKGIYYDLTNKVIFLILEKDSKMLDYGLDSWGAEIQEPKINYFLEHIANPRCNFLPITDIKSLIEKEMGTHNDKAIKVKRMILDALGK